MVKLSSLVVMAERRMARAIRRSARRVKVLRLRVASWRAAILMTYGARTVLRRLLSVYSIVWLFSRGETSLRSPYADTASRGLETKGSGVKPLLQWRGRARMGSKR